MKILPITLILATTSAFAEQELLKAWPPEGKLEAINGCKLSIMDHAKRDYMKRKEITELSSADDSRLSAAMQPSLAICDCAFDRIEKVVPYSRFLESPSEMGQFFQQVVLKECMPGHSQPNQSTAT